MGKQKYKDGRERIRDIPFFSCNRTLKPYLLKDQIMSRVEGLIADKAGGYKRTPAWTALYDYSARGTILGASAPEAKGASAVHTVIAIKPTGGNPTQARVQADGTAGLWGGPSTLGGSQDASITKVVYHRLGATEYTLGWDMTQNTFGCMIGKTAASPSAFCPIGVEPMVQTNVTLTAKSTGGNMGAGYVRVYLAYSGGVSASNTAGGILGAPDQSHHKDVYLTGTNGKNSIDVAVIPEGTWPQTTHVYFYRTRVADSQAQLDYEPAYLDSVQVDTTATISLTMSDATLVLKQRMETGMYAFPGAMLSGKFESNLGMGSHMGRLCVWGVVYPYRLYIAGYTDVDGNPIIDNDFWQYSLDLPGRDTLLDFKSFRGMGIAIGNDGLYKIYDDDSDPAYWAWQQVASLKGVNVACMEVINDIVMIVGRGQGGDIQIFAYDGYGELMPIGDDMMGILDSSTGILSLDGLPLLTGGTNSQRHVMNDKEQWGKQNVPAGVNKVCGREATYPTASPNAMILATSTGLYYEGTTYSEDESDYVETREYWTDYEEYTKWDKLWIHAVAASATPVTATVYTSIDGADYVEAGDITINDQNRDIEPVSLNGVRGRRLKVKISFGTAAGCTIQGITVVAIPEPSKS